MKYQKIGKGKFLGQFIWMPACTAGADPRTAIPNPPPIKAPMIANNLRMSLADVFTDKMAAKIAECTPMKQGGMYK